MNGTSAPAIYRDLSYEIGGKETFRA